MTPKRTTTSASGAIDTATTTDATSPTDASTNQTDAIYVNKSSNGTKTMNGTNSTFEARAPSAPGTTIPSYTPNIIKVTDVPSCMRASKYIPGDIDVQMLHHAPVPQPKAGEVLLKVAASGVCHTDTMILSNAIIDDRSYTLGHETAAWAVQLGEGVTDIELGRLYALYAMVGCAAYAKQGCGTSGINGLGLGLDGGLAEYIVCNADLLVPVPDGLAPEIAAVGADSLLTVHNALYNVAKLRPENPKRVLVYGIGGLGHLAVQLAVHLGAQVYACDYKPAARRVALQCGAEQAFNLSELTQATASGKFTVDIVFDFVANRQSFALSQAAVRRPWNDFQSDPGMVVIVGFSADHLPMNAADIIINRTHVLSVLFGTKDDLRASLDLLAKGIVKPIITVEPLENLNKVLDDLRASEVQGRRVILPNLSV
ncbi:GroES-like protein [Trametes cingulata]|nr:GroES-like protein [Trametes cingulata]